jgi:Zn-dependent protease
MGVTKARKRPVRLRSFLMNADSAPHREPGPVAPRPHGFRLGHILGVPVYLNASWLILAAIVIIWYGPLAREMVAGLPVAASYALAAGFVFFLLLSVLLHELGHAFTARRFGIGVRAITLEMLGGYTEMESDSPSAKADLFVALVGPAVSAVLGLSAGAVWYVLPDGTIWSQLAFQIAASNIIVAIFNSLPGLPLDGGRALRAAVWALTGDRHVGSRVAGWTGRIVAVATLGLAFLGFRAGLSLVSLVFMLLVAVTLWQGASAAIKLSHLASKLPTLNVRGLVRPVFPVPTGTPLAEAERRATATGAPGSVLGVADASGRLVALVQDQSAQAVPTERRPWVPVESVARTLDPARTLAVDLTGEDLIRAIQADPSPTYLVVAGDEVVGVLRTADLAKLLNT